MSPVTDEGNLPNFFRTDNCTPTTFFTLTTVLPFKEHASLLLSIIFFTYFTQRNRTNRAYVHFLSSLVQLRNLFIDEQVCAGHGINVPLHACLDGIIHHWWLQLYSTVTFSLQGKTSRLCVMLKQCHAFLSTKAFPVRHTKDRPPQAEDCCQTYTI